LIAAGIDGVEVNHPKNPPEVTARVTQIAEQNGLIMTGGSDFHRPERGTGAITLAQYGPPDGQLERLQARIGR
jgi:predicted metal-dependent phosphoesterase TrpH